MNPTIWKLKPFPKTFSCSKPLQFSIVDEENKWTLLSLYIHKYMEEKENGIVSFSLDYDPSVFSLLWVPRTPIESSFYYHVASLFPEEYILFLAPTSFFGLSNTLPEYSFMRNPFLLPLFTLNMTKEALESACLLTFTKFAKYIQYVFRYDVCCWSNAVFFDEQYGFTIDPSKEQQTPVEKQYFILSWRKRMEYIQKMNLQGFAEALQLAHLDLSPLLKKLVSVLPVLNALETETEDTARASLKYVAEVLDCYTQVNILDFFARKSAKHTLLKKRSKRLVRFEKHATIKVY